MTFSPSYEILHTEHVYVRTYSNTALYCIYFRHRFLPITFINERHKIRSKKPSFKRNKWLHKFGFRRKATSNAEMAFQSFGKEYSCHHQHEFETAYPKKPKLYN